MSIVFKRDTLTLEIYFSAIRSIVERKPEFNHIQTIDFGIRKLSIVFGGSYTAS